MGVNATQNDLTPAIIGVYYDVYNGTGRTYPEFIYERAMTEDLLSLGIPCARQSEHQVWYKDRVVGLQQLDLLVGQDVVVEIKVAPELTKLHKAQTISYLKAAGKGVGLLCNFGSDQPEFRRLYRPRQTGEGRAAPDGDGNGPLADDLLSPRLTAAVIGGLYEVHSILGPGFIHRVYANAVYHELQLRGLEVAAQREYQIIYHGRPVGEIKLGHIQVDSSLMVFPIAVQDVNSVSIQNLKAWLQVQQVPLGIIANFHGEGLEFRVLRV
jgi:GxxExxY protein